MPAAGNDEAEDRLAGDRVGLADDRRLGDALVADERALDLGRADAVAGDVHHVVDAPKQPVVALVVALAAVADEVLAGVAAPVGFLVALGIAVNAAQHRRPGAREDEVAAAPERHRVRRRSSTTSAPTPGSGKVAEPGLVVVTPGRGEIMIEPVSVCHQVSTIGQRPPPMCSWYHIQASGLIGSPTEPSRRSEERSCCSACCAPHFMCARIAVGAQ